MSFNTGTKKQNTSMSSTTNPWGATIPPLNDFLTRLGVTSAAMPAGATSMQNDAVAQLEQNAGGAAKWAAPTEQLATDTFGAKSNSGMVTDAYGNLTRQLTPYANGEALDVGANPYIRDLLDTVKSDVTNQTNSMWGAAGRDFSPGHAMALGRGVAAAEAPLLLNQYNTERQAQSDAAKTLFGAGDTTATTGQQLDQSALATRATAPTIANAATDFKNQGPNAVLNLEQQLKQMPFDQLGWISQYLFPAAQLGQSTTGTSTGTTKATSFGLDPKSLAQGAGLVGQAGNGLGSVLGNFLLPAMV